MCRHPGRRQRLGDSGHPEEWPARSDSKPARVNRIEPRYDLGAPSFSPYRSGVLRSPSPFLIRPSPNCSGLLGQPTPIGWVSSEHLLRLRRGIREYSPVIRGLMFLPFPIVLLISNLFAGWIARGTNLRSLMVLGLSVGAAGYWLLHSIDADTSYLQMLPGFVVIPSGIGLAVPCMTTALLTTVPASRSGMASGVLNSVRQAGGALGVAGYGALLNEKDVAGAQLSFWISAALLILAAIGVKHMKARPNSPEARSE
jgi:MFS family permease